VNIIRQLAKCDIFYSKLNIDYILDERARELYIEEWRFTELSRISYCLGLRGKPDNEVKVYDEDKLFEDSFWW
ncbi:RagB/SusD family nutrient uptake outer membrane protein, partial [Phocaeicola vulgatus]|uniref:RagB/SusD family nutrient uptake outer membrane protein n=1 Tax=Phocaeicola vulgatus TaxID=821 RepID=UPI002109E012